MEEYEDLSSDVSTRFVASFGACRCSFLFFAPKAVKTMLSTRYLNLQQLLAWIKKKVPWLEDRSTDNTLAGCQKKLEEFRNYRYISVNGWVDGCADRWMGERKDE